MSEREPLRITRRTTLKWAALAAAAPALGGLPLDVFAAGDSAVLLWNEAALQGADRGAGEDGDQQREASNPES